MEDFWEVQASMQLVTGDPEVVDGVMIPTNNPIPQ